MADGRYWLSHDAQDIDDTIDEVQAARGSEASLSARLADIVGDFEADQQRQDAEIATKVSTSDLYPADRRTTDISATTDPGIYRFYARNGTANLPSDITATSPFGLLQVLATSTYIAQILIHFVSSNPPDVYIRRSSDSGSSWSAWLKVSGTSVASASVQSAPASLMQAGRIGAELTDAGTDESEEEER